MSEFFLLSFCVRYERTFIDVRVFNPHADSNRTSSISATYQKHENEKRRMYEQRVHVLSATGGMARQASVLYKRLASLLAEKRDATYGTMNWLRCVPPPLLRSAVQCIRGTSIDLTMVHTWTMPYPYLISLTK